jgi:hypothetical protein
MINKENEMTKDKLGIPWKDSDIDFLCPVCMEHVGFEDNEIDFILKAVNNHHALVEALDKCIDDLAGMPLSLGFEYTSLREAKKALEAVK